MARWPNAGETITGSIFVELGKLPDTELREVVMLLERKYSYPDAVAEIRNRLAPADEIRARHRWVAVTAHRTNRTRDSGRPELDLVSTHLGAELEDSSRKLSVRVVRSFD